MLRVLRIAEELGVQTTADLDPAFLDRFVSHLKGSVKDKTASNLVLLLERAGKIAVSRGYLESSPLSRCPDLHSKMLLLNRKKPHPPGPSPAQVKRILDHYAVGAETSGTAHRFYVLAAIAVYTGILRTEAVRIRVSELDFEAATIHIARRGRQERSRDNVPIPPELDHILSDWLSRRRHQDRFKLDEPKIAEARRLKAEGWKLSELSEKYGVHKSTIHAALKGRSWRYTSDDESSSLVADSEWLFPNLSLAHPGPWIGHGPYETTSPYRFDVVGKVAGIDKLTYADLRRFHKDYIRPRIVLDRPDVAGTIEVGHESLVLLGESHRVPAIVLGEEMPLLTEAEWDVLVVLKKYEPNGVELPRLTTESGHPQPDVIVRKLIKKTPRWGKVAHFPGGRGKGGIKLGPP